MDIIDERLKGRNKEITVRSATNLLLEDVVREIGGRFGVHGIACPLCGPIQVRYAWGAMGKDSAVSP
jgi:hypothetical protein